MHCEAISRWAYALGCCLHILWSNYQVSAGYFAPLDLSHITHNAGSWFMFCAWEKAKLPKKGLPELLHGFSYFTYWAAEFKLRQRMKKLVWTLDLVLAVCECAMISNIFFVTFSSALSVSETSALRKKNVFCIFFSCSVRILCMLKTLA